MLSYRSQKILSEYLVGFIIMDVPCHVQCTPVSDSDDTTAQLFAHPVIASLDWVPTDGTPFNYLHAKFEEAILNNLAQSLAKCQFIIREIDSSEPLGNP